MRPNGYVVSMTVLLLVAMSVAYAAPPGYITYQGALTNASGGPLTGTYSMSFAMYSAATGGVLGWGPQTMSVPVTKGVFTVLLGGPTKPLPAGLPNCSYLEVKVGGVPMVPRHQLASVPYALEAGHAQSAAVAPGTSVSGTKTTWVLRGVNASTANGSAALQGEATGASGGACGVLGSSASESGTGVYGRATRSGGENYGVRGKVGSPDGAGVWGESIATMAGTGVLGTVNSAYGRGVLGQNTSPEGEGYGVMGTVAGDSATGVFGQATKSGGENYGVRGKVGSPDGAGVWGESIATMAGTGVLGTVNSAYGRGVVGQNTSAEGEGYGVMGTANGGSAAGVYGYTTNSGGETYGVRGKVGSPAGAGVFGENGGIMNGTGVLGVVASRYGAGVRGRNTATAVDSTGNGVEGTSTAILGAGVYGKSLSDGGFSAGVRGQGNRWGAGVHALGVSGGYAVYAEGAPSYFGGYATFAGGHGPHGDLAENYPGRDVEAGDVVTIARDGQLVRCTKERDTRVAGIVSTSPSMSLQGQGEQSPDAVPLALVGIVACKADATGRPIHAGDLLTTSSTPGHATRALSAKGAAGAIIGKALEDLESGTGVIQVLVTLR